MASNSVLDVLSCSEGEFSGFSSVDDEHVLKKMAKTPKGKTSISAKTKKSTAKGNKTAKSQSLEQTRDLRSSDSRTSKSSNVKVTGSSDTRSSDIESSLDVSRIDLTKLSSQQIHDLREALGCLPHPTFEQSDNDLVVDRPLRDMPNIHVEIESRDISDNEDYNPAEGFDQALFGDGELEVDNDELSWDLPKLKAPVKGKAINESLARLVNTACTSQCDIDNILDKVKVPSNCEMACPPTVNQEVWKVMNKYSHLQDKAWVDIQNLVSVGLAQVIQLAEVIKPHIVKDNNARSMVSDILTVLGQVQYNLSLRRRHIIRPNLRKKYSALCNMSMPVTTKLFGEDISKDAKTCDSTLALGRSRGFPDRGGKFPREKRRYNETYAPYSYRGSHSYRGQMSSQQGRFRRRGTGRGGSRGVSSATAPYPNE